MSQVPAASSIQPATSASGSKTGRPLVLLLEDDKGSSDPLIQLLEHYEFEVRLARTILEAMPLLPLNPRFAILDLMLPDGGGERVLDLIRRRKIATRIAIVTATRDRERLREVARLKPDLMLTKPLDFFRLLEFLRTTPAAAQSTLSAAA